MAQTKVFQSFNDINADKCQNCSAEKYLNPNLKLLVSPCFHKLCENCIDVNFKAGPGICPIPGCNTTLRRRDFVVQTFEDLLVEKEVQIRKRLTRIFNKRPEDFVGEDRVKNYNKYLEDLEEMIFSLVYDDNVAETEEKIKAYSDANKAAIEVNAKKQETEKEQVSRKLRKEKQEKQLRRELIMKRDEEEQKLKAEGEAELLKTLASNSDKSAEEIMREQRNKMNRRHSISLDIPPALLEADTMDVEYGTQGSDDFDPFDHLYDETLFTNVRESYNEGWTSKWQTELGKASGYLPRFTHERALSAVYSGVLATATTPTLQAAS
ncbi:TFIIH/NER complex subunit [Rhizophlyctis rosea]|nr:TFIIH/NER complex subunit [Rhizophlyctis rosea]